MLEESSDVTQLVLSLYVLLLGLNTMIWTESGIVDCSLIEDGIIQGFSFVKKQLTISYPEEDFNDTLSNKYAIQLFLGWKLYTYISRKPQQIILNL